MATILNALERREVRPDLLSGTPRAHFADRWIYVFTAASFIIITLTGFIPDSIGMLAAVRSGERPPLPIALHFHAVLMASFLLLLLAQTTLVATGRRALHMRLGRLAMLLVPAMVLVGIILIPTIYHQTWDAAQKATGAARINLEQVLAIRDDIMLLQFRIGLLFPLFIVMGLRARRENAGFHKRMMILATAIPLVAGIDRIDWLPTTFPTSPLAGDLYMLAAVSPMFLWDVIRNRRVHEAYLVWLAVNLPVALTVYTVWDKPWWHSIAPHLMGV